MTAVETEKYPLLIGAGAEGQQAYDWLLAGRGVRVWTSQEIGKWRPNLLTPADTTTPDEPPHWAYSGGGERVLRSVDEVRVFRKHWVIKSWTATAAGWKAVTRQCPGPSKRPVPIGYMHTQYSIEEYEMLGPDRGDGVLLDRERKVGIVEWTSIEERSETPSR